MDTRIKTLQAVLADKGHQKAVEKAFKAANGDWTKASASLQKTLPGEAFQKATLAHVLADWSEDNIPLVKALVDRPNVASLRDVALHYNVEGLTKLVNPKGVPESATGTTAEEKARSFAVSLNRKSYVAEPTAVLQRMVQDAEVPIADVFVRAGVTSFLSNQPAFNIRTTSIYTALKSPDAFKGIADEHRAGVVEQLKILQRVQVISPVPEAVPVLMKANLTSAFQVAEMPESAFLRTFGNALGEENARQVYTLAINNRIRSEHAF
jgi:hypothetical protein